MKVAHSCYFEWSIRAGRPAKIRVTRQRNWVPGEHVPGLSPQAAHHAQGLFVDWADLDGSSLLFAFLDGC
jgi:hypothetical protein